MSAESPAFANQASSYGAEQTRRAVFSWAARTATNTPGIISGGLLSASDCQLSAPGSGLSVNISTGEALIGGSEGGTQGGYYGRLSSTTNLAISTANPSLPRIDTVSLTIADSGYTEPTGVSGNALTPLVTVGTPTSGASLSNLNGKAALPLSSLLLGYVLVPAAASNIITADIANKATVASMLAATNFLQLATVPQTLAVAVGVQAVVWPNSTSATAVNVSHGLSRTPISVQLTQAQASGAGQVTSYQAVSASSSLFQIQGQANAAVNATVNVYWIAIG